MKSICVFCGSSSGDHPNYQEAARNLGQLLAEQNLHLIYGGGNVGLMGIMADASLAYGGKVTGVIPKSIADLEIAHRGLTELFIVDSMSERKDLMGKLSDGFIAMPGGFGTLDELAEVLTYNQLRVYDKPVGLLNVNAYFDGLLAFFDHSVEEKFVRAEHRANIFVNDQPTALIHAMQSFKPVQIKKWISDIRQKSPN